MTKPALTLYMAAPRGFCAVIFSAHGVPKSVPAAAAEREMIYVDATCPLVSKVHIEAQRHADRGLQMIMIGHEGHLPKPLCLWMTQSTSFTR